MQTGDAMPAGDVPPPGTAEEADGTAGGRWHESRNRSQEALEDLTRRITGGQLPAGSRLTHAELRATYALTSYQVHRLLARLRWAGLVDVTIGQHRGVVTAAAGGESTPGRRLLQAATVLARLMDGSPLEDDPGPQDTQPDPDHPGWGRRLAAQLRADRAAATLRERIGTGELPAGTRLRTVAVADEFGLTRETAGRVLEQLAAMELTHAHVGHRPVVTGRLPSGHEAEERLAELRDLYRGWCGPDAADVRWLVCPDGDTVHAGHRWVVQVHVEPEEVIDPGDPFDDGEFRGAFVSCWVCGVQLAELIAGGCDVPQFGPGTVPFEDFMWVYNAPVRHPRAVRELYPVARAAPGGEVRRPVRVLPVFAGPTAVGMFLAPAPPTHTPAPAR